MAQSLSTFTFRTRKDLEGDFISIEDWCKQHNFSVSSVFNSYLPAICYALLNSTYEQDGEIFARSDFGDVKICRRTDHIPVEEMTPRPHRKHK